MTQKFRTCPIHTASLLGVSLETLLERSMCVQPDALRARRRVLEYWSKASAQAQIGSWQLADWHLLKDLRQKRDDKAERKEVLRYFQIGFYELDDKEKGDDALVALRYVCSAQKWQSRRRPYLPRHTFPRPPKSFPKPNAANGSRLSGIIRNRQSSASCSTQSFCQNSPRGRQALRAQTASPLPRRETDV